MNNVNFNDFDYTNSDDLPLSDHIEWDNTVEQAAVTNYCYEMEYWKPLIHDSEEIDLYEVCH